MLTVPIPARMFFSLQAVCNMLIMTGIEVNSEARMMPACLWHLGNIPATEGNKTHFTIDWSWQSLFALLYLWSKWRRNVN